MQMESLIDKSQQQASCLLPLRRAQNPALRLLWFPHAGGGASAFRPYIPLLPPTVVVDAFQLPGRENRLFERPIDDFEKVMEQIIAIDYTGNIPTIFWGHSLGGLIAFELCARLNFWRAKLPALLVVSGCSPPSVVKDDENSIASLPDDQFIEEIIKLNGTPDQILTNPESASLFLPLLRADFTVAQEARSRMSARGAIDVPILALGGAEDAGVAWAELQQWSKHTTKDAAIKFFPGGHFFINENRSTILQSILGHLQHNGIALQHQHSAF